MEKYYTADQMKKLKKRREWLGERDIDQAEQEWMKIFDTYKAEMEKGTDPGDEAVQALASRSVELIEAFTGGDPTIEASLTRMYQEQGGPQVLAKQGVTLDQDVWDYMQKAVAIFKNLGEK